MNTVTLQIDGKEVTVAEGDDAARRRSQGRDRDPDAVRLPRSSSRAAPAACAWSRSTRASRKLVASCVYPVEEGLAVTTENERILKHRKLLVELLWPAWVAEAKDYGVTSVALRVSSTATAACAGCACATAPRSRRRTSSTSRSRHRTPPRPSCPGRRTSARRAAVLRPVHGRMARDPPGRGASRVRAVTRRACWPGGVGPAYR